MVTDLRGPGLQAVVRYDVYNLFRYFPYIRNAGYGEDSRMSGQ